MNGNKWKASAFFLIFLTALCLASCASGATEAENLTAECKIKLCAKGQQVKRITDEDYRTYWESGKMKSPYVTIHSERPIYGLYLCFQKKPDAYEIQGKNGTTLAAGDTRYHHVFYALKGETDLRIQALGDGKITMGFNEIFAFGEGDIPGWVQRWEEPEGETDLLFLAAHPDDELLFMGSAIATAALVDHRNVQVAYLTPSNTTRRSEALNGLWTLGLRRYPEFGPYSDRYAKTGKLQDAYDMIKGGKKEVRRWVTEMIRKYRPKVMVTHDLNGEYGHPQHKMLADAAAASFELAAEPEQYPESAQAYGTWQVQKLYLHLYGGEEDQTRFDWSIPRAEFGGLTANELSQKAFEMHVTQAGMGKKYNGKLVPFSVEEYGVKRYPNNCFGLYISTVGPDTAHDDFLENTGEVDEGQ
ncbi:MAG: PIG-L family deacetylase [Clostridia bacterium]|nr:PIG-L family deacetylase [Clostridia bacterium]